MPNYQGLMQMVGQKQGPAPDQPISPEVQKLISDSINRIRQGQGLPPAPQEENFLFYIEANPQLKQLIDRAWKNFHIQNSGTDI